MFSRQVKLPRSNDKYEWTKHVGYKMAQYGLSAQRITRVIRAPQRVEEGIVKNTVAVMQPVSIKIKDGKKNWKQEIWCMYKVTSPKSEARNSKQCQERKMVNPKTGPKKLINPTSKKLKIISAWRYPGVSPKRDPIPDEILRELGEIA